VVFIARIDKLAVFV